jgi:radical SAM superfamily enzyme YgiQ (UPF0313 family)
MRVLLINPYYPISETPSPPLGLAFLAAALEAAEIEVQILDLVVYPYTKQNLQDIISDFNPHLVGATAVTMNFSHAASVLQDVKGLAPNAITVMGGPHVSFCAQNTLDANPQIDVIVMGEGEDTIVELAKSYQDRQSWDQIKGLTFRTRDGFVSTPTREPIANIDNLPDPARHLVPLGRYRALGLPVSMTTSRGCPFKCIFCVGRKMVGGKVRYRNPSKVVDELAYLNSLDFQQINIADDLFTASKKHCLAVCDEIIQRNLEVQWTSFARVDTVSKSILERMHQAGCTAISFGVESGSTEILKCIKKGIALDQVLNAVNLCNQVGITPQASFILGLPGENEQTLQETIAFADQLKNMGVLHGYHLLAPFPGTEVRENQNQYDLQIMSHDWDDYHANRAIVQTSAIAQQRLDGIVKEWQDHFDTWLDDVKKRRDNGTASQDEAWPLTNLEHIILIYDLMMKSAIENMEPVPHDANTGEVALDYLVAQIDGQIDHPKEQIRFTLQHAIQRNYLSRSQEGGQIRWEWIDYV